MPFGGVPAFIKYLSEHLLREGWNVYILSGGYPKGTRIDGNLILLKPGFFDLISTPFSLSVNAINAFAEHKDYFCSSTRDFLICMSMICQIEKLIGQKISIISSYHILRNGLIGSILSQRFNVPHIVTNFGEIYEHLNAYKKSKYTVNKISSNANRLLSVSNHCAKSYSLLDLNYFPEVIPVGIDVRRFNPKVSGKKVRIDFGFSQKDFVVLFMARMIADMGLNTLLEAIPKVLNENKRIKFLICGGKGELTDKVKQVHRDHPDNVLFETNIAFTDQPSYYALADVVVAPSANSRACMGMAIKEAMATGKPVIASNVGGIPEAVINGFSGILVKPEDPVDLAEAVLSLSSKQLYCQELGNNGQAIATRLFDEKINNAMIEEIFRKTI